MAERGPYGTDDYIGEFNLLYAEKILMQKALKRTFGCIRTSAFLLGINERSFAYKIKLHSLQPHLQNCLPKDEIEKEET